MTKYFDLLNLPESMKRVVALQLKLAKHLESQSPKTKSALLILGNYGWYLDREMYEDDFWACIRSFEEGKLQEADEELMGYFASRSKAIEAFLVKSFPARAVIIESAFKAHFRREYNLSVPVFLIQTEGICSEITGKSLFKKEKSKPETAKFVKKFKQFPYQQALLSPLSEESPVNTSKPDKFRVPDALNRHRVLHGESVDYGTRRNSLKGISLLNYVAQMEIDLENGSAND